MGLTGKEKHSTIRNEMLRYQRFKLKSILQFVLIILLECLARLFESKKAAEEVSIITVPLKDYQGVNKWVSERTVSSKRHNLSRNRQIVMISTDRHIAMILMDWQFGMRSADLHEIENLTWDLQIDKAPWDGKIWMRLANWYEIGR